MKHYDETNPASIFEYSKQLLGKTLRDYAPLNYVEQTGKGGLGEMVEKLFFGYENNSDPHADFLIAGVELKCSPLKKNKKKSYSVKERLVCNMINYVEDVNVPFDKSHFFLKCRLMLILYYLHIANVSRLDLEFIYSILWKLPEKDLLIIQHDYEVIMEKVKKGKAHEISEGDTMYLGACRKGAKGTDVTAQPYSPIPAPTRAFCLKMAYMRTILSYIEHSGKNAICNYAIPNEQLVSALALQHKSFDDIVLERFEPYIGKYAEDISFPEVSLYESRIACDKKKPKHDLAMVAAAIASEGKTTQINKTEEFLKAGLTLKTIRIKANGRLPESISFERIDYQEVYDCEDWCDSRLYEIFTSRFLFVIFKEQNNGKADYVLEKAFFWTMPTKDLLTAEEYWNNIRDNVRNNKIEPKYFWKLKDHNKFHVRPKARNSADLADNPNGGKCMKYGYWFNQEYMTQIIEEN